METFLSQSEKKEIEECIPLEDDFVRGSDLEIDRERLASRLEKAFYVNRRFSCFQHFKEFALTLCAQWGFHLNTKQSWALVCGRNAQSPRKKSKTYVPASTPERRVRKNVTKVGCQFKILTSPVVITGGTPEGYEKRSTCKVCPVRITNVSLLHGETCHPSVDSLILSRKNSGYYSKAFINPDTLREIMKLITGGKTMETNSLRTLLEQHLPNHVQLNHSDIYNFRVRAKLLFMSGADFSIDEEISDKIFNSLDDRDRYDGELTRRVASQLLREALRDSGTVYAVESFLEKLSSKGNFFYTIGRDTLGHPTGITWATTDMIRDFVRFGDFMSLDMMKRQYNTLYWPYSSACVLDDEERSRPVVECLCVEESSAAYVFMMQPLFSWATGTPRTPQTIRAIFGDLFFTNSFLEDLGINETCRLFRDHYHLMEKVWMPRFEKDDPFLFQQLRPTLQNMLNADCQQSFETAVVHCKFLLRGRQEHLEYMNEYFEHPEYFAAYEIDKIPGMQKRRSSQFSEANHASIVAHLGTGGKDELEEQIHNLIQRNLRLRNKWNADDYKYRLGSSALAAGKYANDTTGRREAVQQLSSLAFKRWEAEVRDSCNYTCKTLEDGSLRIHRKYQKEASARVFLPTETCTSCDFAKSYGMQCRHSYLLRGSKFDPSLFSCRYISQDIVIPYTNMEDDGDIPNNDSDNDSGTPNNPDNILDDNGDSDPSKTPHDLPHNKPDVSDDGQSEDEDSYNENVTLSQLAEPEKSAQKRVYNFRELSSLVAPVLQSAAGNAQTSALVAGVFVQMAQMLKGSQTDMETSLHEIAGRAHTAMFGGRKNVFVTSPLVAKENKGKAIRRRLKGALSPTRTARHGRDGKVTCGFCGDTGHKYTSCKSYHALGSVVHDKSSFAAELMRGNVQVKDREKDTEKSFLDDVPKSTKWLVFHGCVRVQNDGDRRDDPSQWVAQISSYAEGGQPEREEYKDFHVPATKLNVWIAKQTKNKKKNILRRDLMKSPPKDN